jgi:cell pole-organizing protein PopZ
MSDDRKTDPAMADILASIRRIVAEEDRRFADTAALGEPLLLTPAMRVDQAAAGEPAPEAPADEAPPPAADASLVDAARGELSIDESHIVEIARAVVREELAGAFGQTLTRNVKALVRDEVARALAARDAGP